MRIEIRPASDDDFAAITDIDSASFGESYSAEDLADFRTALDLDRFLVAVDADARGRVVGITGDFPFPMTVPGGRVDVPGVTWVSVELNYRRRGVLRALMQAQLTAYRAAGHPAAILTASQSGIYARFGYGAATRVRRTVVERRRVRLRSPGDPGAVRRIGAEEARRLLPDLHERWCAQTPGALGRRPDWWDRFCADRESARRGQSGLFFLVHPDGYVAYRIRTGDNDGDPSHLCWIVDYAVTSAGAHADLWQVLLGLDLVGQHRELPDPHGRPDRARRDDPRLVRTTHVGDGIWVRPLDIAALLGARSYGVDVDAVIAMTDPMFGDQVVRLQGGPDGATGSPTAAEPDVVMDAETLGAVYLGGVRLAAMARAGRVALPTPRPSARWISVCWPTVSPPTAPTSSRSGPGPRGPVRSPGRPPWACRRRGVASGWRSPRRRSSPLCACARSPAGADDVDAAVAYRYRQAAAAACSRVIASAWAVGESRTVYRSG